MRLFFGLTWRSWRAVGVRVPPGPGREAVLGVYGPLAMMALFGTWALGIILGFALLGCALALLEAGIGFSFVAVTADRTSSAGAAFPSSVSRLRFFRILACKP